MNIPVEQIEAKFSFEKLKISALEFVVRSLKTGKNNRQIEFQIILQYSTKTREFFQDSALNFSAKSNR